MRRVFPVAICRVRTLGVLTAGALLAIAPAALAQRGGGHAGGFGGGHVGGFSGHSFGGGFAGHSFGGNFVSTPGRYSSSFGARSFAAAPRMTYRMPARSFAPGYRAYSGVNAGADRRGSSRDRGRYRSPYRGYGYAGYPYYSSWEVLPWDLGYPDFTGYGDDSGSAQAETAAPQQDYDSAPQTEDGYRQGYGVAPYGSAAPVDSMALASEPQLTLIFKDGHQLPIRNYALTGDAVIDLDQAESGRQQSIPLGELDLAATEKAAQEAGIDFSPPA